MVNLNLIPLASLALILKDGVHAAPPPAANPQGSNIQSQSMDCLETFNKARKLASLPEFTKTDEGKSKLFESGKDTSPIFTEICSDMSNVGKRQLVGSASMAFAPQEKGNCEAAVMFWKLGAGVFGSTTPPVFEYQNQGSSPPNYLGKAPYDNNLAVSLVTLFNPSENATLECAFVRCPAKAAAKAQTNTQKPLKGEDADVNSGLVCLSEPTPLQPTKAPFTEEQWQGVSKALKGSASPIAASIGLAIAAGVAGLVFY